MTESVAFSKKICSKCTVIRIYLITILYVACSFPETNKSISKGADGIPNVILIMADDLGWGDVAYNGNKIVKTPHLDSMAGKGIQFNHFYAAAPVCSPTRASCLTGRHPYRVNIPWAGDGFIPKEEITIAEAMKTKGYATGHFGKWHVGGLSKTVKQSYFPGGPTPYAPPWENGFDVSFSTESMVPTYNPYYYVSSDFGTSDYKHIQDMPVEKGQKTGGFRWRDFYWTGSGQIIDDWLEGDDSKIIMDQALKFIRKNTIRKSPFLSVIWFHTPHTPVVAGNEYRAQYPDQEMKAQHWYGAITAMDEQIGRLRNELKVLGIANNTILWFCSDNGPSYIHNYNSSGPFKGKKAELYEGGIRVPAILEWPAKFRSHQEVNVPCVTSDFYPTLLNICGIEPANQPPVDGEDILPILAGAKSERTKYIGFQSPLPNWLKKQETENIEQFALVGNRYKLMSMDNGQSFQLYDLKNDLSESKDLSGQYPQVVNEMKNYLNHWIASCKDSAEGKDYTNF